VSREGSTPNVPPEAVGRYRALQQIRTGSFGPIFSGDDAETGRPVAISRLSLSLTPDRAQLVCERLRWLVRELPAHEVVPRVLDVSCPHDDIFLVTELPGGEPLDVALREYGPAALADAWGRLRQLADALDRAAAGGVWHGALQPRDIWVSADRTWLTHLGVASALERVNVTVARAHPYTPPEMTAGQPSTPRADQYALAAIAHEWLFGLRISGPAEGLLDVPSVPGVARDRLAAALTQALSPRPEERFGSCGDFVDAMGTAHAQESVTPAPHDPALGGAALDALPVSPRARRPRAAAVRSSPSAPPAPTLPLDQRDDDPAGAAMLRSDSPEIEIDLRPPEAIAFHSEEPPTPPAPVDPTDDPHRPADAPVAPASWQGRLGSMGDADPDVHVPDPGPESHPAPDWESDSPRRFTLGALVAVLFAGIAMGLLAGYLLGATRGPAASSAATGQEFTDGPVVAPDASGQAATGAAPPTQDVVTPPPATPPATSAPPPAGASGAAARPGPPPPAAPPAARLLVRSTPTGAVVTIDGVARGTTPLTLRDLDLGVRTVVISRPGFVPAERRITLTTDRPSRSVDVTLASATPPRPAPRSATGTPAAATSRSTTGTLVVESRPSGATVTIDGQGVGSTPVTVATVSPGRRVVRIERLGFRSWQTTVEVKAGERARVAASLEQTQ
jgi:eukaryotic-like serine/threonine-protein kinase